MAEEQTPPAEEGLSEETLRLAAIGRGEEVDPAPPADEGDPPADPPADLPDWLPEKFQKDGQADYEAMAKAYAELEKKLHSGDDGDKKPATPKIPEGDTDGDPEVDPEGDPEGSDDGDGEETPAGISPELFDAAQAEWADTGELSADTRQKILDSGVPAATLDTYLAGVQALSQALTASVHEVAGGEEAYANAVDWAKDNWSPEKIQKFNASLADADMMPVMVGALMNDYSAANPGEGTLTESGNAAGETGDVYHDPEEFTNDLAAADAADDTVARKAAVKKLERSKKAGTLKYVTPRSGTALFG